jgi:hypothetical protein
VKLDRAARLQQAKAIGWTAYRLVRAAKIEGYIEIDDGRKLVRGPATAAGVPPGFKEALRAQSSGCGD